MHTYYFLLFVIVLSVSCGQPPRVEKSAINEVDTLYVNSFADIPSERFLIKIADQAGNPLNFSVNESQIVKVDIPNFNEYPILLKNPKNVELLSFDTISNMVEIIPHDTLFTIDIWQNFNRGNVVRKLYSDESNYEIIPQSGEALVGRLTLTAKRK